MSDYMKTDAKLLPYLPFHRFLLGADLTQTAKLLYAVLLDRANLSRANGWTEISSLSFRSISWLIWWIKAPPLSRLH